MPQPNGDGDAEDGVHPPAVGAPDNWRKVRWVLVLFGWAVIALLGLFALLRVVAWDSVDILIVVNALTLIVYLPAWLVAAGAAIGRRWWLLGAAGLVIVAQVAFVAPEFLAASPLPRWALHAPIVRLFDANIDKSLTFAPGYLRAIASDHPDVISFEEITPSRVQTVGRFGDPAFVSVSLFGARLWRHRILRCLPLATEQLSFSLSAMGRSPYAVLGGGNAADAQRISVTLGGAHTGPVAVVLA